jgi:Na+-transporting NADH:ubiquinone oxidoreductase subunit C
VRQSNSYILIYAAVLTIVCGGLLAFASEGLKERQTANVERERKSNILSTVMTLPENAEVEKIFEKRVRAFVINTDGEVVEGKTPGEINVAAEYKKPSQQRLLPLYEMLDESNPEKVTNVVIPVYGYGLWNNISGYIAFESDMNTLKGVTFQHVGETPGLGARISDDPEVPARYTGKKIFEGDKLVSITMMKGEGNDFADDAHRVDGMSGATLTAKGVNNMLMDYLTCYKKYLTKNKKS